MLLSLKKNLYYTPNPIKKNAFSTKPSFFMDEKFTKDQPKDKKFLAKWSDLWEERQTLESDKADIEDAMRVASKIHAGETPTDEESKPFLGLINNYDTFFDSDAEEEGSSSVYNRLMKIRKYIKGELKANEKAIFKETGKQVDETGAKVDKLITKRALEKKEASKDSLISEVEKSSTKRVHISEDLAESSKKSRTATSEYIDDLPYNPFDDIGTD